MFAPFFGGLRRAYRFLPPFFFPPLAVFFAISSIPPFVRDFACASTHPTASPLPPGTSAARVEPRRFFANFRVSRKHRIKKIGGVTLS